ncbi:Unknown protein sequence [Pseudomonas amygdali pv. morsprunorum]|nr:Unknown protein sequence [Pseudomonas amygdali pv. morsprunorum]
MGLQQPGIISGYRHHGAQGTHWFFQHRKASLSLQSKHTWLAAHHVSQLMIGPLVMLSAGVINSLR